MIRILKSTNTTPIFDVRRPHLSTRSEQVSNRAFRFLTNQKDLLMRLCRFETNGNTSLGYYFDDHVIPLHSAVDAYQSSTGNSVQRFDTDCLLDLLPPSGKYTRAASQIADWISNDDGSLSEMQLSIDSINLMMPIPRPNKLFLLAGNYAAHVEEGGDIAVERAETFPYVFMKPPTTTLRSPNQTVPLPSISPDGIDYELELAVIIGKECKSVREANALDYVAGYTVINDISDRRFRPNPDRRERDRDKFFDWLHGKWHDGFCPCGPCITSSAHISDPQTLAMQLRVNGEPRQDASTSLQVFSVAAVIEFISSFVTLEAGDIISTGTPAGVGAPKGIFLKPGDTVAAHIDSIGTLKTTFE